MDNIVIIDGNSLVNRAFYALPPMNSPSGTPTQAVFGFVKMLIGLVDKYSPKYLAVAFDLPRPTFRHIKYPDYKGTRKGMPDDLKVQMPILKDTLRDMNIAIVESEGYEADDILGTIARRFGEVHTYIVTGDQDCLQLIDDTTTVLITRHGISELDTMTVGALYSAKQLTPSQIIDYKALRGDTSDNIVGVKGIGDKTANDLLSKYSSLDGVYSNLDSVKDSVRAKLVEHKDSAYLSYELATIYTSVPLDITLSDCLLQFPFGNEARQRFVQLGFKTFATNDKLFGSNAVEIVNDTIPTVGKVSIDNIDSLRETLDTISKAQRIGLYIGEHNVGISDGSVEYVVAINGDMTVRSVALADVIVAMQHILSSNNIVKAVYDQKELMHKLHDYGATIVGCFDVKMAIYLINYNLLHDTIDKHAQSIGYGDNYATLLWHDADARRIELGQLNLDRLYYDIEMPLVQVLFDMELEGMRIDTDRLRELGRDYALRMESLAKLIFELAGSEFNINSPKQLAKVLFEDMGLVYPVKKGKGLSTGVEILTQVDDSSGIIKAILDYRELAKLGSTYVEGLLKRCTNDVVHTEFKQMLTYTGRLSSVDPNLQNIPTRTAEGRRIRESFVAREGKILIFADYSQIELRLLAHLSGDDIMINAFRSGLDIHTATASEVFGLPLDKVDSAHRRAAKAVNFGIIYGMSEYGLASELGISVKKAKGYIEAYFAKYPSIKRYLDECIATAKASGRLATMLGRIRYIPELASSNYNIRQFGERAAMNMPMQGSAADIVKIAMNKVYTAIKGSSAKILLQVHDELIVECDEVDKERISTIVKDSMESAISLKVPLIVDVDISTRWE